MGTRRLTLSVPEDVVKDAKRYAARHKTSVSAMFTRFVMAIAQSDTDHEMPLGPITLKATGIASLPRERTERELLEDALEDRFLTRDPDA